MSHTALNKLSTLNSIISIKQDFPFNEAIRHHFSLLPPFPYFVLPLPCLILTTNDYGTFYIQTFVSKAMFFYQI